MDAAVVRRIRDRVAFRTPTEALLADPIFCRELALLRAAEQHYRMRGIDIRDYLDFKVSHPAIIDWQDRSDEIVKERPSRSDLRNQQRRGILRMLDGDEEAFALDPPPMAALPVGKDSQWRVFRLYDEAEYYAMRFIRTDHPAVPWRPAVDILTHRQVRAIGNFKASTLDYYISAMPELVGGLRRISIPPEVREVLDERARKRGKKFTRPRDTLHRVVFETMGFLIWLASNQN
ncbi:MAG TPA: hypothetical protein VLC46_21830 [Thermoanaerobaculia bacterium]|nr:hypothetical protein [Thermoanaerobaculia bacterium]